MSIRVKHVRPGLVRVLFFFTKSSSTGANANLSFQPDEQRRCIAVLKRENSMKKGRMCRKRRRGKGGGVDKRNVADRHKGTLHSPFFSFPCSLPHVQPALAALRSRHCCRQRSVGSGPFLYFSLQFQRVLAGYEGPDVGITFPYPSDSPLHVFPFFPSFQTIFGRP